MTDDPRWDPNVSLEALYYYLQDPAKHPTPQATVEAIMFAVRTRGLSALKEPATVERLSRCNVNALDQISDRISKLQDQGALK
jgi:hypothetical protein